MGLASAFRFVALNISELIRRAEFYMKGSVIKMKIRYLVKDLPRILESINGY